VSVQVEVDFVSESQFYVGYSEDLSDAGLFVATYAAQPMGTEVSLRIELGEAGSVEAVGRVVWIREGSEDAPPGMGLALDSLGSREAKLIRAFIRRRPPLFYDV
jgi:uncharacterized protein (TIGR02266 family)